MDNVQDRVNFHQTPGRGTAGGWGLTPPDQTEPGIPCHVTSCGVPVGEGRRGGDSLAAWEGAAPGSCSGERLSGSRDSLLCFLLICTVVVTVPSVSCSVKLLLSQPIIFAFFLSFLLLTPMEGGAAKQPGGLLLPISAKPS